MNNASSGGSGSAAATIFIVDDEPMLLELASMILKPHGYNIKTFRDPTVAIQEYAAAKPLLILTDYAMGPVSGLDLITACRKLDPQQKIVLVSGTVDESILLGARDKPDLFLAKPYQVYKLVEVVRQLTA